jgi:hypothetical protein
MGLKSEPKAKSPKAIFKKRQSRRKDSNRNLAKPVSLKHANGANKRRNGRGNGNGDKDKSMENWIRDAACSIRGAQDAPKYKDFILPLVFTKRLCDVFDDELNRIAANVGSRDKAFKLAALNKKLVRF